MQTVIQLYRFDCQWPINPNRDHTAHLPNGGSDRINGILNPGGNHSPATTKSITSCAEIDKPRCRKFWTDAFYACALLLADPRSLPSSAKGFSRAPVAERYVCSRLNGAEERTMPDFRCHMLDERGEVLYPADLTVDTVEAAILHAFDILRYEQRALLVETCVRGRGLVGHEPAVPAGDELRTCRRTGRPSGLRR